MDKYKIMNIHPTYKNENERQEKYKEIVISLALEWKKYQKNLKNKINSYLS